MKTLTMGKPWGAATEGAAGILSELEAIERRLESLVSRSLQGGPRPGWETFPPVDLHETEREFILQADVPQLEKSEIKVSAQNGQLEISGEKTTQQEQVGQHFFQMERAFGSFRRTFGLPPSADLSKAKARLRDGVLTLTIPKNPKASAQSVQIELS